MKARVLLLTVVVATVFSCKKSNDSQSVIPPPQNGRTVEVKLELTGDIEISESPLGRKVPGMLSARTLNDSTLYIVEVAGITSCYKGAFNRPDSITLKIPATTASGYVKIAVVAVRRGSGPGLYYTWDAFGQQYFPHPVKIALTNRIDTSTGTYRLGIDTLNYLPVFDRTDTTMYTKTLISEVDAYSGTQGYRLDTVPRVVKISMRRSAFGIKYNVTNFTSGRLIADFAGSMPTRYFTPADIAAQQFIYTSDNLRWTDNSVVQVQVTLKWEKPDGTIITLGQKAIWFGRNILTTLNVTIPSNGPVVSPVPTDTTFTGNETINF
jgi:hypothetical protein